MIQLQKNGLGASGARRRGHLGSRQKDSRGDRRAGVRRAFVAVLYALAHLVMQLATFVYFRRIEVLDGERFPRAGPVVLVVNHPSTWADVVVLAVALGRKLRFITHESLFRPWPRGLVLRLFGSLPILFHHERSDATQVNRATFARCHAAFRRGEVIAFFPEGVSHSDRTLLPLKTGAARLLLEDPAPAGSAPILVPVAIGYEDRTAFRGDVTLAVAPPLDTGTARIVPRARPALRPPCGERVRRQARSA